MRPGSLNASVTDPMEVPARVLQCGNAALQTGAGKPWGWLRLAAAILVCACPQAVSAGANAFASAPLVPIDTIVSDSSTVPTNTPVKVQGAVTFHHRLGSIFLQQESRTGIFAEARTNSSVTVGEVVEVIGFVTRNGYSPTLRNCIYRSLGRKEDVEPEMVTGPKLYSGRYDMRLVEVAGHLMTEPIYRADTQLLYLEAQGSFITVELSDVGERSPLSQLRPGSTLQVTGVCSVGATSKHQPTNVRVQLRSSNDIAVLRPPPWWTPERTAVGFGLAAAVALAALAWVAALRHNVRRKTAQIAERLQREAALEERYRRIVDTALEGILLLNAAGRIQVLNRFMAEMLGYPPAQVIGRTFVEFVDPDCRDGVQRHVAASPSASRPRQIDVRLQNREGKKVWVLLATNSFLDEEGAPAGTLAMIINITERKHAEDRIRHLNEALERRVQERTAELESANRELEAFSYSVSHDLRAPLRAIGGFAQALIEDYLNLLDDAGKLYLERIRAAAGEMNRLIDGLLSLAKVTRTELHRDETDLSAMAASVLDQVRDGCSRATVSIEPGLVDSVDRNLIRIVLSNLLQNACKFSSKASDPRVEVGRIANGKNTIYFVRDNGAGFDPAHTDKLFRVFQRLHTAAEYEGSGIGLATVKRIVQRHGGRVWAEGKPGEGACFYFTVHPD